VWVIPRRNRLRAAAIETIERLERINRRWFRRKGQVTGSSIVPIERRGRDQPNDVRQIADVIAIRVAEHEQKKSAD
jgi:hypothetical protein